MQQGQGRPPILAEKHVLISLWYLGNNDQYYEIGEVLRCAPSAAFSSVHRVSMVSVNKYGNELIKGKLRSKNKLSSNERAWKTPKNEPSLTSMRQMVLEISHPKALFSGANLSWLWEFRICRIWMLFQRGQTDVLFSLRTKILGELNYDMVYHPNRLA